jgi:hypothetical protein
LLHINTHRRFAQHRGKKTVRQKTLEGEVYKTRNRRFDLSVTSNRFSCSKSTLIKRRAHVSVTTASFPILGDSFDQALLDTMLVYVFTYIAAGFLRAGRRAMLLSFMAIGVKSCPWAARAKS